MVAIMKYVQKFAVILFSLFALSANGEVVLDSDDNVATFGGTWTQSTALPGYYGTDFASAQGGGTSDTARFFSPRPITSTGNWCIQARWTQGANRSNAAKFQVFDGTTLRNTFTVNQQINGNAWRRLGCVSLTSGLTSEVRLSDTGVVATSLVVADGIRWVWEETQVNQDLCIAVNGGWGSGGVTFVGKNVSFPANGTCKPWIGMMKAASTVVGTSSGAVCKSNDGKLLTVSLQTTAPEWQGPSVIASDHIELCPLASTQGCPAHAGQFDRGTNAGPAAQIACTAAMSTIPSSHD
jgi:hypothetical protein